MTPNCTTPAPCNFTWSDDNAQHVCGEPKGHEGPHIAEEGKSIKLRDKEKAAKAGR